MPFLFNLYLTPIISVFPWQSHLRSSSKYWQIPPYRILYLYDKEVSRSKIDSSSMDIFCAPNISSILNTIINSSFEQNHGLQLVTLCKKRQYHIEALLSLFKFTNAVTRHATAIQLRWVYAAAISTAHSCYATATLPCMATLGVR